MSADAPQHLREAYAKLGASSCIARLLRDIAQRPTASVETMRAVARRVVDGNKYTALLLDPMRPQTRSEPEHPASALREAMRTVLDSVIIGLVEE